MTAKLARMLILLLQCLIANDTGSILGKFQLSWSLKGVYWISQLELDNFVAVVHVVVIAH